MIKSILNENNDDLRHLLEEGSGITKYKARRKETQRKLDRTQSDLVRLYDIIDEIAEVTMKFGGHVVFLPEGSLKEYRKVCLATRF